MGSAASFRTVASGYCLNRCALSESDAQQIQLIRYMKKIFSHPIFRLTPKKDIDRLRQKMEQQGKGYISIISIVCEKYEVIETDK